MSLVTPTPESAPRIAAWSLSAGEARRWCSRAEHPFPPQQILRWWTADDVQPWILADDGGETPIAYGELWLDEAEDEVELARVIVDPDRRGAGVGRRLVHALVDAARSTGRGACILRVDPDNTVALRLYRTAGFADVDAERSEAWNAGQPTRYVWMERTDFPR
jgi:[ribosomal protein S18]-alanine N-acetyltransferase